VAATATSLLTPASAQAEDARAERLNGNGFYRFKIGDFQATVISDGPIPIWSIFPMNASERCRGRQSAIVQILCPIVRGLTKYGHSHRRT
jgi:hypothetical protein